MILAKLNEVLSSKKSFISDRLIKISLSSALLINIIHWAILLFKIGRGQEIYVLHYNIITGADFVDKAKYLYLMPSTALAMILANILLCMYFFRREKLPAYFLSFSNIPIQLIFLTAMLAIISINEA
jgi:hypothetical protein